MKIVLLAVKLAVTALLAWVVLKRVSFVSVGDFLESERTLIALAVSVVILGAQAVMAALRLRWIMRLMGKDLPVELGFSTWMIGLLVSQVTFIAGDATRIWQLAQHGYGHRAAGGAIFLERALGFAVLMAMVLMAVPFLLARGPDTAVRTGLMTVSALCVAGIGGFILSGFFSRIVARLAPRLQAGRVAAAVVDVASAARHLGRAKHLTAGIILLSVAMHLCNALAFYAFGVAADVDLDVVTTTAIALPVMLIALMPITLAGWGVREGAAVVGYGLFGVGAPIATEISIAFGLALIVASLPGGFYLWFGKSSAKEPIKETESLPA